MSGNRIFPYKNRRIDYSKPVLVYRNLNSKELSYSIWQKGHVVAHTNALTMTDVTFIVRKAGQDRVIRERKKNVHAFIKGTISRNGTMGTSAIREESKGSKFPLPARITYNPYEGRGFVCSNLTAKAFDVECAGGLIINNKGVYAAYLN